MTAALPLSPPSSLETADNGAPERLGGGGGGWKGVARVEREWVWQLDGEGGRGGVSEDCGGGSLGNTPKVSRAKQRPVFTTMSSSL